MHYTRIGNKYYHYIFRVVYYDSGVDPVSMLKDNYYVEYMIEDSDNVGFDNIY